MLFLKSIFELIVTPKSLEKAMFFCMAPNFFFPKIYKAKIKASKTLLFKKAAHKNVGEIDTLR